MGLIFFGIGLAGASVKEMAGFLREGMLRSYLRNRAKSCQPAEGKVRKRLTPVSSW
jgi:hypothetical protein